MSAFDEDGIAIGSNLPMDTGMTYESFCRQRGYDPDAGTYAEDEAPDHSGNHLTRIAIH